jgi:hypothetical protein
LPEVCYAADISCNAAPAFCRASIVCFHSVNKYCHVLITVAQTIKGRCQQVAIAKHAIQKARHTMLIVWLSMAATRRIQPAGFAETNDKQQHCSLK